MKITQEVRDYAKKEGIEASSALEDGLSSKAQEFTLTGGELYLNKNSN
jgi:phosphomethylpyrimidine synthase